MTLHPRPQLTRPRWIDLSGAWGFAYDDAWCGLDEGWQERPDIFTRTIQVPFPPESPLSGVGDTAFHPVVWYRRTFRLADEDAGRRLLFHCGAVDYRAQVWVNDQLVATHEGGHTPFSADITAALRPDEEQVVVIRAEDAPLDLAQPRGKQDWHEEPHAIWYQRTTGIWQSVWLEPLGSTYISHIRWTPDVEQGLLKLFVRLKRHSDTAALRMRVQLSLRGKVIADDTYMVMGTGVERHITFDRASVADEDDLLWSPDHPHLIDATLTLLAADEVIDEVQSYCGLRSIGTDGRSFLLNGRPYYLRFVLEQGYWPQSHLAAPNDEALRREVELAKELGFNGVRIHQKVEDPRFLYWCDRLGLLVWGEMANAYVFSPVAIERLTREWLEVLARDYSHPCIVAWVPINESWGVPNLAHDQAQRHYVQALYHLTKALDPIRLTLGNEGFEHSVSDIYGIHDYSFEGSTLRERYGSRESMRRTLQEGKAGGRALILPGYEYTQGPLMLTEFGGISLHPESGVSWYGYGTVADKDAFLSRYRELVEAILDSPDIAGFCYTQLTDTGQETNGLLTAQREPKLDVAAVREITSSVSKK